MHQDTYSMRVHFQNHGTRATVNRINRRQAFVNSLYTMEHLRRAGWAGRLMTEIINWADEEGVELYITAQEYGQALAMNNNQLVAFYESYGFERCKDGPAWPARLYRPPSRGIQAP